MINPFSEYLKGKIILIKAYEQITKGPNKVHLVVASQFAYDLEVLFDLSHGHLVQGGYLEVGLVGVCLAQGLYAVDQEEEETDQPGGPR